MRTRVLLLAIVAVHLVLAGLWIARQELPQGGRDEFFIVEVATELGLRLGEGDRWNELKRLVLDAYYPPLTRLPGVVALWAGGGYDAMLVAQALLWVPLLIGGTFVAGRKLAGDPGGLIAVAVLLAGPGMADGLHRFEPTLGPTAAAACVLAAWLHSDDLRDRRGALLLGLFLGLGLMSDRLGVLPFAILPLGLSLLRARREALLGLGIVVVAAIAVCGWWYLDFFARFLPELVPQLVGGEITATGAEVEVRPPFLWFWLHYGVLWLDTQLGLVAGTAAVCAVLWAVARPERAAVRDVVLFLVGGLILFTLVPKRQAYYTMPLLPAAAALVAAMAVDLIGADRRRLGGVIALLGLASLPNVTNAVGLAPDMNRGLVSWVLMGQSPIREELLGQRYPVGGPARDVGLDMDAVMASIDAPPGAIVAAFSDGSQVSESFLVSLGRIARQDPRVVGVCLHPEGIAQGPRPVGLVVTHRDGDGWPTDEAIRRSFTDYYGWQDAYEGVIDRIDRLRADATLADQRDLTQGERVSVWRIAPSD